VKMAEYQSKQDHTAAEEDRISQEKLPVITRRIMLGTLLDFKVTLKVILLCHLAMSCRI